MIRAGAMRASRTDSASAALLRSRMPSGVAWISSRNFFVSRPSELSCRQAVAPAQGRLNRSKPQRDVP